MDIRRDNEFSFEHVDLGLEIKTKKNYLKLFNTELKSCEQLGLLGTQQKVRWEG